MQDGQERLCKGKVGFRKSDIEIKGAKTAWGGSMAEKEAVEERYPWWGAGDKVAATHRCKRKKVPV